MTKRMRVFITNPMRGLEDPEAEGAAARGDDAPASLLAPIVEGDFEAHIHEATTPLAPDQLALGLQACDGLLCLLTDRIDAKLLAACPRLAVISSCSVGVDHIDVEAATAAGIRVGNTPGVLTDTTAELAIALMLAAGRRVVEGDRFLRKGAWRASDRWSPAMFVGRDLLGSTLGVIGLGPIGQAVARRAIALGMSVLSWSRTPRAIEGVEMVSLDALLERSDFVSVHLALTNDTRGLIGREALSRMKRDAVLINTARGGIVDEAALADALAGGRLGAAGLDVFEREPIALESPLLQLENAVLTPHVGSASRRTRRRMVAMAVENLRAGLLGEPMPSCVNAGALG